MINVTYGKDSGSASSAAVPMTTRVLLAFFLFAVVAFGQSAGFGGGTGCVLQFSSLGIENCSTTLLSGLTIGPVVGPFQVANSGGYAGLVAEGGNTSVPTSLPLNSSGWLGPDAASFTSYFFQPNSTAPSATGPMLVGAVGSNVVPVSYGTVSGTGTVFPTTASPTFTGTVNISGTLLVNSDAVNSTPVVLTPTVDCLCGKGDDPSNVYNGVLQQAYIPIGAPGGTGYTNGDTWTGTGGTCTTEPSGLLTVSSGAITALSVLTQGICTGMPAGISTVDGGSGALVAFSACNNTSDAVGGWNAFNSLYTVVGGTLVTGNRFKIVGDFEQWSAATSAETVGISVFYGSTRLAGTATSGIPVAAGIGPAGFFAQYFTTLVGTGSWWATMSQNMSGSNTSFYNGISQPVAATTSSNHSLSIDLYFGSTGVTSGVYTSGITATGAAGTTCLLTSFNGTGGAAATATVYLTGTNTIAASTPLYITNTGRAYTGASTSATAGSGTATCSGTATIATTLGGAQGNAVNLGVLTVIREN